MVLSIDVGNCSGLMETCDVTKQVQEEITFCTTLGDIDPIAQHTGEALGKFIVACTLGRCPGQNIEHTRDVLRSMLHTED